MINFFYTVICSAKSLNGGFLEKPQDFYLQEQGQLSNLIQKDRSLVSLLKLADFATRGPGERPFLVAE
jgi:hypothetical protein